MRLEVTGSPPFGARLLGAIGLLGLALFSVRAAWGFPAGGEGAFEVLYVCSCLVPAALCIARGALIREGRACWLLLGAGMLCWAAGFAYYLLFLQDRGSPPYPSLSDGLWLGFYGCGFVAVMLLLRARVSGACGSTRWSAR
jgi:hypothetical protein